MTAAAPLLRSSAAQPPCATSLDPQEAAQRAEHLDGVRACLEVEAARAAAQLAAVEERHAGLRQQLEQACTAADAQHEGIVTALAALSHRLDAFTLGSGSATTSGSQQPTSQPLLGASLPDAYARACTTLLDALAGYVQHHNSDSAGDSAAAAAAHQLRQRELMQLQGGLCKAEGLRVAEQAELARMQAELEVLRAPSAPAAAASLGYSAADLEAEVTSLRRRRASHLEQAAAAAEAAAATAAGADVVEEQAAQLHASMVQRLQAKQQAAAMLTRHLARQLLVRQLLQREESVVQEVQAAAAAARADAELALQAALDRLPGPDVPPQQGQQQPEEQQAAAGSEGQEGDTNPVAEAQQLLACRAQLQQLLAQVQADTLPAQQAVLEQLRFLLYGGSSGSGGVGSSCSGEGGSGKAAAKPIQRPELSPPELQEQLAEISASYAALERHAQALIAEVQDRQRASGERELAITVLVDFWGAPQRLVDRAAAQQRKLERFA